MLFRCLSQVWVEIREVIQIMPGGRRLSFPSFVQVFVISRRGCNRNPDLTPLEEGEKFPIRITMEDFTHVTLRWTRILRVCLMVVVPTVHTEWLHHWVRRQDALGAKQMGPPRPFA